MSNTKNHKIDPATIEAELAAIVESSDDAIIGKTLDGTITSWNIGAEKIYGYTKQEVLGKSIDIIYPPHLKEELLNILHKIKVGKPIKHYETQRIKKDGTIVDTSLSISLIKNKQGKIIGASTIGRDISFRKIADRKLEESEEQFRNLVELSAAGIFIESEGKIVFANDTFVKMVHADSAADVYHKLFKDFMFKNEQSNYTKRLGRVYERFKKLETMQSQITCFDGSTIMVAIAAAPCRFQGKLAAQVMVHDITREQMEKELLRISEDKVRKLNEELEKRVEERTAQLLVANKELESFSYSVSHDLRSPLRAINGFSQALLEDYHDKLDRQGQEYLQRVRSATQRMDELIEDMLNLSRTGRYEMKVEEVNLSEMAVKITHELTLHKPDRRAKFIIAPNVIVIGDSHLLRIVMENLLNNAWKFSSQSPIAEIEFGVLRDNADQPVYFVRDKGIGFNMQYASKLFGPFQRLHTDEEFPGTGIGLATVQRIIRRYKHGKVWLEGALGKGATCFFTL